MSNQTKDKSGPAFPCPRYVNSSGATHSLHDKPGECGMSLRDYFAAAALTGFLANEHLIQTSIALAIEQRKTPEAVMADRCYKFADAMLAARGGAS